MKILIISNKYLPNSNGGAERSMHEFAKYAANKGYAIHVITKRASLKNLDNISLISVDEISESILHELIKRIDPSLCICQLDWTPIAVKICNALKLPIIHFSRVGDINLNADAWVFNYKKLANKFIKNKTIEKKRTIVFYPIIELSKKRFFKKNSRKFITLVNPVFAKGGEYLEYLARKYTNENFVALHGWHDPQLDGIDLSLDNIIYLDRQNDLNIILEQTKILLVPSIWEDPSPRVILEAASYGIPVLGSHHGGIPEILLDKDLIVEKDNFEVWSNALNKLLKDSEYYKRKSLSVTKIYKKYILDQDINFLLDFVKSVVLKNNYLENYQQEFVNMDAFRPKNLNIS